MRAAALAAAAVALIAAWAAPAAAEAALSKKDRERAAKAPRRAGALPRPGARPAELINLYNAWTHEWLAVAPGEAPAPATLDRFLRDHYTNQPASMEPRLLETLLDAARQFRSDAVTVVSAFRHPKYNLLLRKKGHQVARDSNHTKGNAVDFFIPKIGTLQLHAWAKARRLGGVGLYLASGFIHMDTGPVRYWTGE